MIVDEKFGFVICRDGHILVTDELRSSFFKGYTKYGVQARTTCFRHYFPISTSVERLVYYDQLYSYSAKLNQYIKLSEDALKRHIGEKRRKTIESMIRKLTKLHASWVLEILEGYQASLRKDIDDENIASDRFLGIDDDGEIIEGIVRYKCRETNGVTDSRNCDRTIDFSIKPVGPGSEWAVAYNSEHCRILETAMRSTDTKEELLMLLRKIGAISVGEWITPKDYLKKYNIPAEVKAADDRDVEHVGKFVFHDKEKK